MSSSRRFAFAAPLFLFTFWFVASPSLPKVFAEKNTQIFEVKTSKQRGAENVANAVPFSRAGEVVGVRFFQINPSSIFAESGLQNNDILKQVDGAAIRDPIEALKIFDKPSPGTELSLGLERQLESIELKVRFIE